VNRCREATDCSPNTCTNGGTCDDSSGLPVCTCVAGYEGPNCETNIDDCVANACVNGRCQDGVHAYSCNCDYGFGGPLCNVDVDLCAPTPCADGSRCVDSVTYFECYDVSSCPVHTSQINCSNAPNHCIWDPSHSPPCR
jgi:hypothetical protein